MFVPQMSKEELVSLQVVSPASISREAAIPLCVQSRSGTPTHVKQPQQDKTLRFVIWDAQS